MPVVKRPVRTVHEQLPSLTLPRQVHSPPPDDVRDQEWCPQVRCHGQYDEDRTGGGLTFASQHPETPDQVLGQPSLCFRDECACTPDKFRELFSVLREPLWSNNENNNEQDDEELSAIDPKH